MGKKNDNNIIKSKYFKWGLTAFLVILCSVFTLYIIYNGKSFTATISHFVGLIMPIVDGLIVAYLLTPLVNFQENKIFFKFMKDKNIAITDKRKNGIRAVSIVISLLIVILLIFVFFKSVVPQLIESIQKIISQMPLYLDNLIIFANNILSNFEWIEEKDVVTLVDKYYENIMSVLTEDVLPSVNDMKGWIYGLYSSLSSVFGALWDLFIGFFIAVYLLFSKEKFKGQSKKLIYSLFKRERANLLIADIRYVDKTFGAFIVGKLIDSIIMGLLCFIVITLFGIEYPILISVIVGVTNIIPFFGPFLGAIPSAILLLLINPTHALSFIIIILILQQIDGNILGPLILGNSTGLSGFWVIFAITLFGGIWGVPGMFLGVPTFACIYAWIRRRMKMSLADKDYVYDTDNYIDLKFISDDNEFIMNDHPDVLPDKSDNEFVALIDSKDPVSVHKKKRIKKVFLNIYGIFFKLNDNSDKADDISESTDDKTDK